MYVIRSGQPQLVKSVGAIHHVLKTTIYVYCDMARISLRGLYFKDVIATLATTLSVLNTMLWTCKVKHQISIYHQRPSCALALEAGSEVVPATSASHTKRRFSSIWSDVFILISTHGALQGIPN